MIGHQLTRSWAPIARNVMQSRGVSVIAGPPRVHVAFAEKLVTGIVMTCGMLFTPAWVLYHLKDYKGKE